MNFRSPETCSGLCHLSGRKSMIINVWAYTSADSVELFLDNKSLGVKVMPLESESGFKCRHVEWNVTYTPGTLMALAYKNESRIPVANDTVVTSRIPFAAVLTLDFPSNLPLSATERDVALVRVEILDVNGVRVPTANNSLDFTVETIGDDKTPAAIMIGLGNGDPDSHEKDRPETGIRGRRSAFNGLARVVMQTVASGSGQVKLRVESEGLQGDEMQIVVL